MTTTNVQQLWDLDPVGNWSTFDQDDNGNGTCDLKQARTNNKVNEITVMTETTGATWHDPAYDAAGNTTEFPAPSALNVKNQGVYDAWNRLVEHKGVSSTLAKYEYMANHWRANRTPYVDGVAGAPREYFYSAASQVLEERLGSSPTYGDPQRQFVWGQPGGYIDDLTLRDRDTSDPHNGVLNERIYALQDANWNVTTLTDATGSVLERWEYDAYGHLTILTPAWASSSSTYDWETTYSSYRYDDLGLYHVRYRIYHADLGLKQARVRPWRMGFA